MSGHNNYRICAVAAIAGALTLFVGTFLHPSNADPNDPLAAFTEYAADSTWIASHLMQLFGMILIVVALALLSRLMSKGGGASWAYLGVVGAGSSLSVAGATQAVDGIALKLMVDRWAAASGADKEIPFLASVAVRQIEIGLASILALLFGITVTTYGVALVSDRSFPRWLGWLAILGGIPIAVAGLVMAYIGFSDLGMTINLSGSSLALLWMLVLGVWMWHLADTRSSDVAVV